MTKLGGKHTHTHIEGETDSGQAGLFMAHSAGDQGRETASQQMEYLSRLALLFATQSQLRSSETAGTDLGCTTHSDRMGTRRNFGLPVPMMGMKALSPTCLFAPAKCPTNEYTAVLSGGYVGKFQASREEVHRLIQEPVGIVTSLSCCLSAKF